MRWTICGTSFPNRLIKQSNRCDVENQDTAGMGDTGVEGLNPLISGANAQDTLDYQHIGDEDNQRIQYKYKDYKHNWIKLIEGGISLMTS